MQVLKSILQPDILQPVDGGCDYPSIIRRSRCGFALNRFAVARSAY
jgi:hypothetical protein